MSKPFQLEQYEVNLHQDTEAEALGAKLFHDAHFGTPVRENVEQRAIKTPDQQAVDLVEGRPEVKQWLALFKDGTSPSTGGHPEFSVEPTAVDRYRVRAYESMPDHQSTFNFYDVNLKTGTVVPMFTDFMVGPGGDAA